MNEITAFIKNIKLVRSARLFFNSINAETYYPEKNCKSYWQKLHDNFLWSVKYREPNIQYCAYGLDIIGSSSNSFLAEKTLCRSRNRMNGKLLDKKNPPRRNQTALV